MPFVFAVEEGRIVSAVDNKPKRLRNLRRLGNIAANPAVCVLVDQFEEDWNRLWWVRADGRGRIVSQGNEYHDAIAALTAKYRHYSENSPDGPAIVVDIERVAGWTAR